ncbi:MAG: DUF892 family protein [Halalkalicoccus sp.]
MTIETKEEMFIRELRKLYHAELEILDLHRDLSEAAASEEVAALFAAHREDTTEQIDRIEGLFEAIDADPAARGSPIMEGLVAEKDEFVSEVANDELRDLDAIGIGTINERIEITLLDRLIMLATDLDLSEELVAALEANRSEAEAALGKMQAIIERRRSP